MNKANPDLDSARVQTCQEMLFPCLPREVCESLGLNWWAAVKLHADGWLSFNPDSLPALDERQEVELRFVGALVASACDDAMLHRLLDSLEKPFCYRPNRVFYDWTARSWRLLPEPPEEPDPNQFLSDWISSLEEDGDVPSLEDIKDKATDAITRLNKPSAP